MGDCNIPHFICIGFMDNLIDRENLPKHIAIIMDGNGRWAKKRKLPRTQGHMEGIKRVEEIVEEAARLGIKVLTLFTFSTENWQRPKSEISMLMRMLTEILKKKIRKLKENNIQFQTIGRKDRVPKTVMESICKVTEETKSNTGLIVNLAFNYGGRLEIVDAIKNIVKAAKAGELTLEEINESTISKALYTYSLPDPDLLIRTSGEKRISNFLLWQLSYAEMYFTDICWPDFNIEQFHKAIFDYQCRERRFGNLKFDK